MDKSQGKKCRPYLAKFPPDELPVLVDSFKDFKTDLEPQLHNMAKAFAHHRTTKLQHKMCSKVCNENQKCSKKCIEEQEKRQKEPIFLDSVESRLAPIIKCIERGENPDTIVVFEDREFACTSIVLSGYSKFFMLLRCQTVIDLRESPMTASTFELIYKWMIKPNMQFEPRDVVRIIRAAYFLDIPELVQQCFALLDSDMFKEFWAFNIMYSSRNYNDLYQINQAMATRISRSTLIILCSREFLQLNEIQICSLLQSSSLCVNSESELLFGVLHWLDQDWPSRASCVAKVLQNIRFAYLSPRILCKFNGMDQSGIGPFARVLEEFDKSTEKQRLVGDGIFYSTLVITMGGDTSNLKSLPTARAELMVPRRWIYDKRCPYHRPVTRLVPNMRSIDYEDFVEYSETLQETEIDYEQYFVLPDDSEEQNTNSIKLISTTEQSVAHGNINNSDEAESDGISDIHSVTSCVPSEFQVDDTSVNSMSDDSEDIAGPLLVSSADEASTEWLQNLNDFVPSEIWKEWEQTLLGETLDEHEKIEEFN